MGKAGLPKRFWAYIATQGLGAFNDNFFKMLIQLYILNILVLANGKQLISWATYLFTIPFVLFGPISGYLADRYSKAKVMKVVKFAEIGVMLLGGAAFLSGNVYFLVALIFLMATQSTFFGPSKYGYIPEISSPQAVTAANGWLEMSTFLAIILGTALVGLFLDIHNQQVVIVAGYCLVVAVVGSITALAIPDSGVAGRKGKIPWNPFTSIVAEVRFLKHQKPLFLAALANSYFWLLGLIFQTNILIYAGEMSGIESMDNVWISLLAAFMGIGIAAGSLIASRWSGQKVELGLVPLGGLGMAFSGILLFFTSSSYWWTAGALLIGGACGGLYIVPLYAYLQFYANENEKGRVMAAAGIMSGIFLVGGALIFDFVIVHLSIAAATLYLWMGILTIGAVVYICTVIPEYFIRFSAWLLTHTLYRIKIVGEEHIPFRGAALLAPNHVTYVDAFLIGSTVQRFIRFIMLKAFYDVPLLRNLLQIMQAIPIDPAAGRESVARTLAHARQELLDGHVVCIFPEGKLTRDGNINEFRPGFETVMEGVDCPIIPVYLENAWGSIFSYEGGKVITKMPTTPWRRMTIIYGEPLPATAKAAEVEAAVRALAKKHDRQQ